jgi:hypothetical protein
MERRQAINWNALVGIREKLAKPCFERQTRGFMKITSWNIAGKAACWKELAASGADIALLQEATEPPDIMTVNPGIFATAGTKQRKWRAAVVHLNDRIAVEWVEAKRTAAAIPGTLALARVCTGVESVIIASMYGMWQEEGNLIWADMSVHRIIDDLAGHVRAGESLIAAGDLNTLNGYGEDGNRRWAVRHAAVFQHFEEAGLIYCGPFAPNGRQAFPWPRELPEGSLNVSSWLLPSFQGDPPARLRLRDGGSCWPPWRPRPEWRR